MSSTEEDKWPRRLLTTVRWLRASLLRCNTIHHSMTTSVSFEIHYDSLFGDYERLCWDAPGLAFWRPRASLLRCSTIHHSMSTSVSFEMHYDSPSGDYECLFSDAKRPILSRKSDVPTLQIKFHFVRFIDVHRPTKPQRASPNIKWPTWSLSKNYSTLNEILRQALQQTFPSAMHKQLQMNFTEFSMYFQTDNLRQRF
jgi:hypothetical protein